MCVCVYVCVCVCVHLCMCTVLASKFLVNISITACAITEMCSLVFSRRDRYTGSSLATVEK